MSEMNYVTDLPKLSPRAEDANKGTFGKVLVIAGSRGMSGAAILTASAALRSGAGLVRVAVPASILATVAAGNPCYTLIPLPEDDHGQIAYHAWNPLSEQIQGNHVVAVGPGLGPGEARRQLMLSLLLETDKPMVLDADGLNAIQNDVESLRARTAPLILTPHPGEFARLLKTDVPTIQSNREDHAVKFAHAHGVVLLLKGHQTIVTDGSQVYLNDTGNPGMATGGSGDVLTGIIAALVGQGMSAFDAAQLGAWTHGRAGDLARDALGEQGMIASDLLDYLPQAWTA